MFKSRPDPPGATPRPLPFRRFGWPERQRGGIEIVQVALMAPIALLLISAIVDFGLILNAKSVLVNASRVAVREAIRDNVRTANDTAKVRLVARQAANGLLDSSPDTDIVITPANLATAAVDSSVTVSIQYVYQWRFISTVVSGTAVTLNVYTTMKVI